MNTFFNDSQSFLVSNVTLNWIIEDHKERNFESRPPFPLINMAIRLKVCLQSCLIRPVQQVAELVIKVVILPFALIAWAFAVIRNQPTEGYKRYFKSLLINVIAAPFIVILSPCYGVAQLFLSNNLMLIPKRITNSFSLEERRGDLDQLHETADRSTAEQSEIRGRAEEVEALIEAGASPREEIIRELNAWCSSSSDANKEIAAQRILECFDEQNEVLDLSSLGLTSLPNCVGNLTSLTYLNLALNRLNSLPEGIGELRALTSLDLGNNQLTSLPEGIRNLTSLTFFDLRNNQLTSLPRSIVHLSENCRIHAEHNPLTTATIQELQELTRRGELRAHVFYNMARVEHPVTPEGEEVEPSREDIIRNLDEWCLESSNPKKGEAAKRILKCFDKQNEELNLSYLDLTSLPSCIEQLWWITDLNLCKNHFEELPECIGELQELKTLRLDFNKIKSLPDSIRKLQNLEQLSLTNNKLEKCLDQIQGLESLKRLYLSQNQLQTLPEWFDSLLEKKLTIHIQYNPFLEETKAHIRRLQEEINRKRIKATLHYS